MTLSIKSIWLSLFIVAAAAMLSACGNFPGPSSAPPAPTETPADADAPAASVLPGYVLRAPAENPYLEQAPIVPAPVQQAFNAAVEAMKKEDWRTAEVLLQQLTLEQPTLSGPYLNLGIVYRAQGNLVGAEQAFTNAITVNDLNLEAYNQLALLKREAGDFEAAEKHYLAAIDVWPRHPASHKNLGILYDLYTGEWPKALEHFEIYQLLQAEPDRTVAGWIIDLQRRLDQG